MPVSFFAKRTGQFCSAIAIGLLIVAARPEVIHAQSLTGTVSSPAERAMEGVLVSAQKTGSPTTITVAQRRARPLRFP